DTSKDSHTGEFIFNYIDQCIEDIGADKIRPRIFWTGCAAHTVDLMLEGISKLSGFARIIDQAKAVTIFIYAHHKTLSMMRAYAKRDIVRPGATSVMVILKVFSPLVKVLRLADGEKVPSLGFIFGEILEAKKSIKEASDHLEKNYLPVFRIIDDKMKGRLDTPLHMAAYFLNPYYFYKEPNIQLDVEVMEGFLTCVETFYHGDFVKQDLCVNQEVSLYKNKSGSFGRALALKGCETKDDKYDPDWLVEHVEEPDSDVNFLIGIQAPRVRDLYDDNFESEEEEDIVDMVFEPDVFQDILLFPETQVAS
ncbi:unnamed protein product, partial [Brassica oleracea]